LKRWLLPVVLLALGCTGEAPEPTAAPGNDKPALEDIVIEKDTLPEGWRLGDIARAAHPSAVPATTHVLLWKRKVDDRPLLLEECLVLADLSETGGPERWILSRVFRHPNGKERGWQLAFSHMGPGYKGFPQGAWVMHFETFTKKPSNKEVYHFMDEHMWDFWVDSGWKVLDAQVCKRTWEKVLKEKPTRDFSSGK
jgi:hypothetical protein